MFLPVELSVEFSVELDVDELLLETDSICDVKNVSKLLQFVRLSSIVCW